MTGTQLHCWKRLLWFWFLIITFALCWGGALLLISRQPLDNLQLESISLQIQTAYIVGLYLWMLWLCGALNLEHGTKQSTDPNTIQVVKYFFQGALLSCISLATVWTIMGMLGWLDIKSVPVSFRVIIQTLLMALSVAWIEERVFRGFMLSVLHQAYSWRAAIYIQASWYALLHLLRTDLALHVWLLAFMGLGLTGVLLGHLFQHKQSLAMGFGLHAFWIWTCSSMEQVKFFSWSSNHSLWTGQGNPIYGASGVLLVGLLLLFFPLLHSLTQQDDLCNNESIS